MDHENFNVKPFTSKNINAIFVFSRELSSTFARLCNYVDLSKDGLKGDLLNLDKEIRRLEDTSKQSKSLRYLYIVEPGVEIRKNQ